MPQMDGFEATKQILSLAESLPPEQRPHVIGITANSDMRSRLKGLESGCRDVINKPIEHTQIS